MLFIILYGDSHNLFTPPFKERNMAVAYPFIALCSKVLNTKTARKAFENPEKQKALFASYALTPAQKKAITSMNMELLTKEFEKELKKAVKEASGPKSTAFIW